MKNIILILSLLLTLCLTPFYTRSQSDTTSCDRYECSLMRELIPLMYKDVLRLDSCRADAAILDSMNVELNKIIDSYALSEQQYEYLVSDLNSIVEQYQLQAKQIKGRVKIEKKRSFWNGFAWGSGSVLTFQLVLLVLLL